MNFRSFFLDYFQKCLNGNIPIDVNEMRTMASENEKAANIALEELWHDGLITGKQSSNIFEPGIRLENFNTIELTPKGIEHIKQRKTTSSIADYLSNINSALKAFQTTLNKIPMELESISSAKQLAELHNKLPNIPNAAFQNQFTPEQIKQISDVYSNFAKQMEEIYGTKHKKIVQNYLDTVEKARRSLSDAVTQTPSGTVLEKSIKKSEKKENVAEIYTFEGILGQNCGEVSAPTGQDPIRIQKKGFKVENGITVLRGFAKSSDIAAYSQADNNYQRDKNFKHLNALIEFMEKMKSSAKYLPEVTLVARGYESLMPVPISGNLTDTQKGEIENLNYYRISVKKDQLYRIDGNHRIEATKDANYYIPFSIIVWDEASVNEDDEAFLFYFLNSKAKKLTSEENLKGLVNAQNWTDFELETANVLLPYIKYLKENFEEHTLFNKTYYKNRQGTENVKTQILNVLELILKESDGNQLPFDKKTFGDYINKSQEILSQRDRFKYLREHFRCFPQFVFYTLYKKNGDTEDSIRFICEVNKWAQYYKHDSNSFMCPSKMFHNASKQLDRKINIFVAMPYYDPTTVEQFNKTLTSLIEEIKQENEELKDKLNLYSIMKYKAGSTDILASMDKQITECDIFIADISNHGKNKVNPNVMFELGRVYDRKKFLLIRNKDNKVTNSAFDIQHMDYIPIDFGMGFDTSMKEKLKPRILNIVKEIVGIC